MKKQNEVRYIVTSVASIPVYKMGSKTEAFMNGMIVQERLTAERQEAN